MVKMRQTVPIKTEREGSKDDRWVGRETKMRDEASAREGRRRNLYSRRKTGREMSVSLTSASVIFMLYQCCAAESRQTDRQRPYDMAHIPGTFSMVYKPCAHTHIHTHSQAHSCTEPALMAPLSL